MRLDEVESFLGDLNTRLLCAEANVTKATEANTRMYNRLLAVEQDTKPRCTDTNHLKSMINLSRHLVEVEAQEKRTREEVYKRMDFLDAGHDRLAARTRKLEDAAGHIDALAADLASKLELLPKLLAEFREGVNTRVTALEEKFAPDGDIEYRLGVLEVLTDQKLDPAHCESASCQLPKGHTGGHAAGAIYRQPLDPQALRERVEVLETAEARRRVEADATAAHLPRCQATHNGRQCKLPYGHDLAPGKPQDHDYGAVMTPEGCPVTTGSARCCLESGHGGECDVETDLRMLIAAVEALHPVGWDPDSRDATRKLIELIELARTIKESLP